MNKNSDTKYQFGIFMESRTQAICLAYPKEEKTRMFKEYNNKSFSKFYGTGKRTLFFFCLNFLISSLLFMTVCSLTFSWVSLFSKWERGSMQIGSGISQAVKGADKISMVKNVFGSYRIETTLTTEKTMSFKRNTIDVWPS